MFHGNKSVNNFSGCGKINEEVYTNLGPKTRPKSRQIISLFFYQGKNDFFIIMYFVHSLRKPCIRFVAKLLATHIPTNKAIDFGHRSSSDYSQHNTINKDEIAYINKYITS